MLTVTKRAAALLKAAKAAEGGDAGAGIRIRRGAVSDNSGRVAVGFTIRNEPEPGDQQLEQQGLRIFVEDVLVEPLDGRTLDVRDEGGGPELIFR
jgi:Fe-S cluster assembly iron-binding protein IscA